MNRRIACLTLVLSMTLALPAFAQVLPPGEPIPGEGIKLHRSGLDTYEELRKDAMQAVNEGLARLDAVVKTKSRDKKLNEDLWEAYCDEMFGTWTIKNDRTEIKLTAEKKDLKEQQAYRSMNQKFLDDIRDSGVQIMYWRGKLYEDRVALESAIEDGPEKFKMYDRDLKAAVRILDDVAKMLGQDSPALKDIETLLGSLVQVADRVWTVGISMRVTVERIEQSYGKEAPALDKKAEAALKRWESAKESFPGVMGLWLDFPVLWSKAMRKEWDEFVKVRKSFDEMYQPLVKGTWLDVYAPFKGKDYDDLTTVTDRARGDLRALRLKVQSRDADMEKLRKAYEEEDRISDGERKVVQEHAGKYGPYAEREMRLASVAREHEFGYRDKSLAITRGKYGSEEERRQAQLKLDDELKKLREKEKATVDAWLKEKAAEDGKIAKLLEARKARRAKLGLTGDFD
ncbi:MAG: hypothetical protein MUE73_03200 [Planctomycetes bacterium]|jgi:hypothetical protein|nr:hypothetical protein [Planctomycetota bacterium]